MEAISPLDGRYRKEVRPLLRFFSEKALNIARLGTEISYLTALSGAGVIRPLTSHDAAAINRILSSKRENHARIKAIEQKINHDTKSVEYFLREKMQGTSLEDLIPFVHIGLTSTDIDNLAWGVLFRKALEKEIMPALIALQAKIRALAEEYKDCPMLGRTHGQPAVPMTLGEVFRNFFTRLNRESEKLYWKEVPGKLSGAVGNFSALKAAYPEMNWEEFGALFVSSLGLQPKRDTTQIPPYEDLAEIFDAIRRINLIVIDLDRDIWSYLSYGDLILPKVGQEVGSSTMPQKVNPIQFEMSEANLKIANAFLEMLSRELIPNRMQRDLTDKELMRVVGEAWAYGYLSWGFTLSGLGRVRANPERMRRNLEEHWEVLGEAIQTILRKHGYLDAYERIQKLMQGKTLDAPAYRQLVTELKTQISEAATAEIDRIGF